MRSTSFLKPKQRMTWMTTRIEPLGPPYAPEVAAQLRSLMPPGVPPLLLFRTFAKHPAMTNALRSWGGYELSDQLSLDLRAREIVIDRTCVRCGCEYEWGVHIALFAERANLSPAQVTSITHGSASDDCWTEPTDRLLIEAVDSLHDSATINDELAQRLHAMFTEQQLLDLYLLTGWYHAISYCANAAGVELEAGTPRFADHR